MSIARFIAAVIVLTVLAPAKGMAETKELKKGPPCLVEKAVDDHLFQIYVSPPKSNKAYTPGKIRIFIRRAYPDYLYVPLEYEKLKDGRLHVQIAISPEKQATYSITVLDKQRDEYLQLFWKELSKIKEVKRP